MKAAAESLSPKHIYPRNMIQIIDAIVTSKLRYSATIGGFDYNTLLKADIYALMKIAITTILNGDSPCKT